MRLAEQADQADMPDGMSVPEELKRREDRLAAIAQAKAEIEARAAERYAGHGMPCPYDLYERQIAFHEGRQHQEADTEHTDHRRGGI